MTAHHPAIVRREDGSIDVEHYARIARAERNKARIGFAKGVGALFLRLGALRPGSGVGVGRPAVSDTGV